MSNILWVVWLLSLIIFYLCVSVFLSLSPALLCAKSGCAERVCRYARSPLPLGGFLRQSQHTGGRRTDLELCLRRGFRAGEGSVLQLRWTGVSQTDTVGCWVYVILKNKLRKCDDTFLVHYFKPSSYYYIAKTRGIRFMSFNNVEKKRSACFKQKGEILK